MKTQVEKMVQRFLGWKLPKTFSPDAGISFNPEYNAEYMAKQGKPPSRHEPTGTNLFSAIEARQMIEYMLEGITPTPCPYIVTSEEGTAYCRLSAAPTGEWFPADREVYAAMDVMGHARTKAINVGDVMRALRKLAVAQRAKEGG